MSGFMQKQITVKTTWYAVENTHGETTYLPAVDFSANPTLEEFSDYVEGTPASFEVMTGYGARLFAPGYLDCTEWTVHKTEQEAQQYLNKFNVLFRADLGRE